MSDAVPIPDELARGYLTADVAPIRGVARERQEDFIVDEVPLYEPSGAGEHVYVRIEKRGIPTPEAIRRIARHLGRSERDVGYAGLKDAHAITRQTISIARADEARLAMMKDAAIAVLSVSRHGNKLKPGHLRGNRFTIRLRGTADGDAARAKLALDRLARSGCPNYFGLQRFGLRRSSHKLGLALVREDAKAFLDHLLAGPLDEESPRVRAARAAFEAGDVARALAEMPPSFQAERRALETLARDATDLARAVRAIPVKWRSLYVSALQSVLFNTYLTRRLDRFARLERGEVATLHRNGASFVVEDEAREQARADALEISPSGPVFGAKLLRPAEGSSARALEDEVLASFGLASAELGPALGAAPLGERRSLRVPVGDVALTDEGAGALVLAFFLPKGCYATAVLEELLKRPVD